MELPMRVGRDDQIKFLGISIPMFWRKSEMNAACIQTDNIWCVQSTQTERYKVALLMKQTYNLIIYII